MPDPGGSSPIALDYSTAPPRWRRRVRRVAMVLLICGLGAITWRWGPAVRNHIRFRYLQHQCLTYAPPPDHVVLESDPELAKGLLTVPGYINPHFMVMGGGSNYHGPPLTDTAKAAFRPAIWDEFVATAGINPTWSSKNPSWPIQTGICFLGQVQTPSGKSRLVIVECFPQALRDGIGRPNGQMRAASLVPGSTINSPLNYVESYVSWLLVQGRPTPNLRIFAGQRDPNDPTRFSIRVNVYGQDGFLDGSVDDAGIVTLDLRRPYPRDPDDKPWTPYR